MKSPLLYLLLLVFMLSAIPAFAYIDPGTGSFLVQGIIAAVIGIGVTGKLYWARIKSLLTGKPMPEDEDNDE